MARGPGRPPKPTEFDEATMAAARQALLGAARELGLRQPAPTKQNRRRTVVAPPHLDLAVLAVELSQALELVAQEHVTMARELDEVTWEQVGAAFGITMQSAHSRFRTGS